MKRTVLSIISLFLFFATSLGALAYSGGYLSFSSGGNTNTVTTSQSTSSQLATQVTTDTQKEDVPQTPGTDYKGEQVDNLRYALSAKDVEGMTNDRTKVSLQERLELYRKLAGGLENDPLQDDGAVSASGVYNGEEYEIRLLEKSVFETFTEGTEVITKYNKVISVYDASYVTHSTEITRARCKIVPYMGYLLISHYDETEGVQRISLCDSRARVLVEDMENITPHYSRDYNNRPVFYDGGENYCIFDGKEFVSIKKESIRSELFYDYPASPLAEYNGKAEVKYLPSYDQYRFVNPTTNKNYIGTRYNYAFNFSENGLAVVMLSNSKVVKVINTGAKSVLGTTAWQRFPVSNAWVEYVYLLPDTLGIESIGCSGFDNGWLRLRVQAQSRMNNSYGTIAQDIDRLINIDGEYFDIPEGYTLEGYSNGVLLLSKDGLYGYYSINEYWIAQPIYDYARPFVQGLAVVGFENGTVGMIDTEGNIVMPFVFTSISDVSSGIISAYIEGVGWNIYSLCAKEKAE